MRYLSYDPETGEVSLVARLSGENENWVVFNDFVPDASAEVESGSYVVLKRPTGQYLTYVHDHGQEGLLSVSGSNTDTRLFDQQIWRILKAHSSYLEVVSNPFVHNRLHRIRYTVIKSSIRSRRRVWIFGIFLIKSKPH